jgi:hypothetical protein
LYFIEIAPGRNQRFFDSSHIKNNDDTNNGDDSIIAPVSEFDHSVVKCHWVGNNSHIPIPPIRSAATNPLLNARPCCQESPIFVI